MTAKRRGAARSEASRAAILAATAHMFAERGFAGLTIEGVAAEAGVGKQTIYRWWGSKGALVAECLISDMLMPHRLNVPDVADVMSDFTSWIESIFLMLMEGEGRALLTSLIAAATTNEDVGSRLKDSLGGADALVPRLERAVAVGELRPEAPCVELSEALVGTVLLKALAPQTLVAGDARRVVDAVLGGWLNA